MKKVIEIKKVVCADITCDKFNVRIKTNVCVPTYKIVDGIRVVKNTDTITIPISMFVARVLNNNKGLASLHNYMRIQSNRNDNVIWDINSFLECLNTIDITYNSVSVADTYKVGDKEEHYTNDSFDTIIENVVLNDGIEDICNKVAAKTAANMASNFAMAGL